MWFRHKGAQAGLLSWAWAERTGMGGARPWRHTLRVVVLQTTLKARPKQRHPSTPEVVAAQRVIFKSNSEWQRVGVAVQTGTCLYTYQSGRSTRRKHCTTGGTQRDGADVPALDGTCNLETSQANPSSADLLQKTPVPIDSRDTALRHVVLLKISFVGRNAWVLEFNMSCHPKLLNTTLKSHDKTMRPSPPRTNKVGLASNPKLEAHHRSSFRERLMDRPAES